MLVAALGLTTACKPSADGNTTSQRPASAHASKPATTRQPARGERCMLPGASRPAQCLRVQVAANPEHPSQNTFKLRVVVLPATAREKKADPLFLLAGGPGQAASEAFGDALPSWRNIATERDLVMVDVRGSGQSSPLDCPLPDTLEEQLAVSLDTIARDCAVKLRKQQRLDHFNTDWLVADLEQVRKELGYQRINLLGVSYGSRLAMRYAAKHPSAIRRMILDAVAPPELRMPGSFAADSEAALAKIFAACKQDKDCHEAFGDLHARLRSALQQLAEKPRVTLRHPRSGAPLSITMTPKMLLQSLRSLLYSPELIALIPLTVFRAEKLQFQGLIGQLETLLSKSLESMSHGLLLSITCAEDVHRIGAEDEKRSEASLMGRDLIDEFRRACSHWKVPQRTNTTAATIATPTLLLSGGLDPVTPPQWANVAAKRLRFSQHLIMPEAAHGIATRGCVPEQIERFLDGKEVDKDCAKKFKRPAFFTSYSGPTP